MKLHLRAHLWLSLLAAPLLVSATGCKEDRCKGESPAFEVDLSLDQAGVAAQVATLRVTVAAGGQRKVADLDTAPLRDKGRTTFVVVVGKAGAEGFEAELQVELLDPTGERLRAVSQSFSGSGDACNFFSLALQAPRADGPAADLGPASDGRPVSDGTAGDLETFLDLSGDSSSCGPTTCLGCCLADGRCATGTTDAHCGQGGARCVDCTATGGLCRNFACCQPTCAGKACGADDGCGGSCASGACPAGQTCVSGSCRCTSQSCADGCCAADQQCLAGTQSSACGSGGAPCSNCSALGESCVDQQCVCVPVCPAGRCNIADGCGGTCSCASNMYCNNTVCETLLCQLCTSTGDCASQCQAWGSTGGSCATPGSKDPANCCTCNPLSTSTNPIGSLDGISSAGVATGWSCDRDNPWASISVHLYVGGAAGSGAPAYATTANRFSEEAVKNLCGGGDYHRFQFAIPNYTALRGQPVYAYGINIHGGSNAILSGCPKYIP